MLQRLCQEHLRGLLRGHPESAVRFLVLYIFPKDRLTNEMRCLGPYIPPRDHPTNEIRCLEWCPHQRVHPENEARFLGRWLPLNLLQNLRLPQARLSTPALR